LADAFGLACYRDPDGAFARAYGQHSAMFLVRPDGYIGWRGDLSHRDGLIAHLDQQLRSPAG
jgi:hypothetical protein